ncbi:MAG: arylsulfatase [Planctomycetaceae bacterium]
MQRTALWMSVVSCLLPTALALAADRPNIVVILVDDMGWSDIGCYGSEIPTPNLDALAAGGLRFTQFYNTGRCSPTRASLLTGHYPHQAGMGHLDDFTRPKHPGFQGRLADSSVTMAEVLQPAGYFTCMTGKWHLGQHRDCTPWNRGFERSLSLARGGVHFYNQTGPKGGAKLFLDGEEKPLNDPLFGDWYGTDLWAKWGTKFIDEALAEQKPFFLYLAHCAPHFPLMAPQEDIDRYRGRYQIGWDQLRENRRQKQIKLGLVDAQWPLTPRADNSPAWDDVPADQRDRFDHIMSIYAAMIERMDRSVGTVTSHLRDKGVLDNTLILFLSDNGGNAESGPNGRYEGNNPGDAHSDVFLGQNWATLNNTPFRKWKHFVHEGGCSTPLIAHWPAGISSERNGQLEHQPGHLIDVMATVVDVGGAPYPAERNGVQVEGMEGVSLRPAFSGKSLARSLPIFFNHEDNRAVRNGDWKLVALKGKPWELYNMKADRSELHDLAADQPERVQQMTQQYRDWTRRTHVVVDDIAGWGAQSKSAGRKPAGRKPAGKKLNVTN